MTASSGRFILEIEDCRVVKNRILSFHLLLLTCVFAAAGDIAAQVPPDGVVAAPAPAEEAPVPAPSPIRILYSPPGDASNSGANWPRAIELRHAQGMEGQLLATFSRRGPTFPIYRSVDGGVSWHFWSEIRQTKWQTGGWGLNYQPTLFELPQAIGEFPAGTILAAGLAFPTYATATELQLFASRDGGKTWAYISTIADGGPPLARSSNPVWEPHLAIDLYGRLVAYFADARHQADGYGQVLALKVSSDGGRTWDPESYSVALPGDLRPASPMMLRLPGNRFVQAFQVIGMPGDPVHLKTSPDGIDWGDAASLGTPIQDANGNFLSGTPFISWSPYGSEWGTLIASGSAMVVDGVAVGGGVMINHRYGAGPWEILETPIQYEVSEQAGYGQSHLPVGDGRRVLQMVPVRNGLKAHNDIVYGAFELPVEVVVGGETVGAEEAVPVE